MNDQKSKSKSKKKGVIREYVEAAIIAILLALFIRTFAVQAFKIPSGSMIPTLLVGDHILVNKFIYGVKIPFIRKTLIPISSPQREDVIVFIYPKDKSKDFIKRVIGLPGEEIKIIGGKIHINGELFDDKYGYFSDEGKKSTHFLRKTGFGPVTVPENHLLVLGDNRDNSRDSRYWGFVPLESVKGKAFIIYWSWPNWKRFLNLIH
ncbi:MAG: signal peptidase I [Desulfobacterales bacterium]|nr:signal peptidase I [Desulfobacterales bacterium]